MFCLNVYLTVKPDTDPAEIAGLLGQCGRLSRAEPGCLRFEVYQSQADPRQFLLCERWESEAAWQDHKQRQAVVEIYQPQVLPHVERVPHPATLLE